MNDITGIKAADAANTVNGGGGKLGGFAGDIKKRSNSQIVTKMSIHV